MKNLQLKAPATYWNIPENVRHEKYHGCGPGHLGDWFVPDTIWGLNVVEACRIHDHEYEVGETKADKRRADARFLHNLIVLIYLKGGGRLLIKRRIRRAFTYYKMVSKFGYQAFFSTK